MTLSDFMNNAATSAIMCPIAIGIAQQLGVRVDPMLMAVAIGRVMCLLDTDRPSEQYIDPGAWRLSLWRLLAAWSSA